MNNRKIKGVPLIIDKPAVTPLPKRIGWGAVTFVFWLMWAYLWLPLVTAVVWALGYRQIAVYFPWEGQDPEMRHLVFVYLLIITGMGGSLILWAQLEYRRFRNVRRRAMPPPATVEELAVYADLSATDLLRWHDAQRLIVTHDDHGRMIDAEVGIKREWQEERVPPADRF